MKEKQEILQQLKREILLLEGFKQPMLLEGGGLGKIEEAFPNRSFPFSALHEFFCYGQEELSASAAFISGLLSSRLQKGGTVVWVSSAKKLFPPSLKWFGIQPHQVLFLHVRKEKEISWAVNESLKCSSLTAVIGEMSELSLTASRRFQLAIEDSGVGCFVLRANPKNLLTAAVSRWHIKPLHTKVEDGFPGIGHPRWQAKLLKARNGKPGSWDIEWSNGGFRYVSKLAVLHQALQKQTG